MKKVITIAAHHIQPGIVKYGGVEDEHLSKLIKSAKLEYIPYVFRDGRILLVLPDKSSALLYANKDVLYQLLDLA